MFIALTQVDYFLSSRQGRHFLSYGGLNCLSCVRSSFYMITSDNRSISHTNKSGMNMKFMINWSVGKSEGESRRRQTWIIITTIDEWWWSCPDDATRRWNRTVHNVLLSLVAPSYTPLATHEDTGTEVRGTPRAIKSRARLVVAFICLGPVIWNLSFYSYVSGWIDLTLTCSDGTEKLTMHWLKVCASESVIWSFFWASSDQKKRLRMEIIEMPINY